MTWRRESCSPHMQPASLAWYAAPTLLLWRPLPASGRPAAGQGGCWSCHHLSCSTGSCEAINYMRAASFAPMQASIC